MKPHPLSTILPPMSEADYARLREDIKANGLLRPIVEYEGMILDGNHRWRACAELGVTPAIEHFVGGDPASFVYSVNVAHRHLTKGQIAIAAAKLKDHYAEDAKVRQIAAQKNDAGRSVKDNCPELISGQARDAAGKAFGVSGKSVDRAETILRRGADELVAKVERGEVSINQGQKIAQYPKDRQRELLTLPGRKALNHALRKSANLSTAAKNRRSTAAPNPAVDGVPGTPLVKELRMRLEQIAAHIERTGMAPDAFAQTFLQEFDWQEPLLVRRFSYADIAIRCLATLSIAGQRAKKAAA